MPVAHNGFQNVLKRAWLSEHHEWSPYEDLSQPGSGIQRLDCTAQRRRLPFELRQREGRNRLALHAASCRLQQVYDLESKVGTEFHDAPVLQGLFDQNGRPDLLGETGAWRKRAKMQGVSVSE